MKPAYEVDAFRSCLRIASLEYFPTLTANDAEFQLGLRLVDGYFNTLVGQIIATAVPFLSPEALCKRLPRYFNSGVSGPSREPEIIKVGDKHFRVTLFGEHGLPWLTAGSVDAVLRKTKVTVAEVGPESFIIDITWV